jgi:hypothetical protein
MEIFKEGTILERRGNRFTVVSIDRLFTKLIRIDDVELRERNKQEMLNNSLFKLFAKCAQDMIISSYDKPGYFYVENNRLNKLFTKI